MKLKVFLGWQFNNLNEPPISHREVGNTLNDTLSRL